MQLDVLEVRVTPCLRSDLRHVELVADVAIEAEALLVQRRDRLACELERNRLVSQPAPAHRLGDDRTLVADDGILQAGFECVPPHRLEHPAGNEDDMNPNRPRCGDRGTRPGMQQRVLADQRPVEVTCDGLDVAREILREVQPCGLLRKSTRSFRSAGGRDLYDFGMTFFG